MAALLLFWFEASSWKRTPKNLVVFVVVSVILMWLGTQFHDLTQVTILAGITGLFMLVLFDQKSVCEQFLSISLWLAPWLVLH